MALTPEDVVNKRFQPTKFREGYDQDEVDDFLDEIVVELRRINQENEELRQRVMASDGKISELQRAGAAAPGGFPPAGQQFAAPQMAQPQMAQQPPAGFPPGAMDANAMDPGNTNNLLQLARRLHEEHVQEGIEKRDALIAEGEAAAARIVGEAESRQRANLTSLDQDRVMLEHRIEELRNFEREYRQKLRGYIEGQLHELDSTNELTAGPSAQQYVAQPQYAAPAPQYAAPVAQYPAGQQTGYPGGFAGN